MITSEEVKRRLWEGANDLRGSMDASRYKDYMLGLMFYKFLSDQTLETFRKTSGETETDESKLMDAYIKSYNQYGDQLTNMIGDVLGYYVLPQYLYQTWIRDINSGEFEVEKVRDSLTNFERTIAVSGGVSNDFKGLFSSSTLDLTNTALGSNLHERSKNIRKLIQLFSDLDMIALQKGDVLGDAYEYLIGQFAMESGKKAGEFYTPRQVSEVMAQIVAKSSNIQSIYDPTVGSGSLLLTVRNYLTEDSSKTLNYYGQEKNTATYNLTRMNLLLHGVRPERMTIHNGNTLEKDWPEDPQKPNEGIQFDAVVMNPPYSVKNWNGADLKVSDPRFENVGALPPNSKGDYAFLLHGLYHLGQQGTMAIVLPHGVLFRSGTEGQIRESLINKNYIDTIIGLPDKLFTNTGIPVTVMILKKNRDLDQPILIIDASRTFTKKGKQNVLREKDIAKIVDTYVNCKEEQGYSHLATRKEVIENEYNLNIPRYIKAIETDIPHNVDGHLFGGIPYKDIKNLHVLQSTVPHLIRKALIEVRSDYVQLNTTIESLGKEILKDSNVIDKSDLMKDKIKSFQDKYWNVIKHVDDVNAISNIREDMLQEIKDILLKFEHINEYDGYQIIADIWANVLSEDTEIIATSDFYEEARKRVPNIVIKGSGKTKREEQDGWNGKIVPNDLLKSKFFPDEILEISKKETELDGILSELEELVETSKVEESDEETALGNTLNENEDNFVVKLVKAELKITEKESNEYKILKNVESLLGEKTKLNRFIKNKKMELKTNSEDYIKTLNNQEIDELMYEKWFGSAISNVNTLFENPINTELNMLEELQRRYSSTLSSLEERNNELGEELELMMKQMVVNKNEE